jgi:uncharacterized protein
MFSLPSFQKILVIVAILAAVWYGLKLIGRLDRERKQALKEAGGKPAKRAASDSGSGSAVRDLIECRSCHAFVASASVCSVCGKALRA